MADTLLIRPRGYRGPHDGMGAGARLAASSGDDGRSGAPPGAELLGFRRLSPKELEVLTLIVYGHTIASAAKALGVSSSTVSQHRASIRLKVGAPNTATLIRLAVRAMLQGVIELDDHPDPR